MLKNLIQGFLDAISALTVIKLTGGPSKDSTRQAYFLIAFPLVGSLFGLIGFAIITVFHPTFPVFAAWFLPVFWVIFSGGTHLLSYCKLIGASLIEGQPHQRLEYLTEKEMSAAGAVLGLVLFLGKIFAVLQAAALDTRPMALTVLLVPIISRYTAVMMAVGSDATDANTRLKHQGLIVGLASLIIIGSACISPALGITLIIFSLITALFVRGYVLKRFQSSPPAVLAAVIEMSEMTMLWVPIIFAGFGLNLSLIQINF